MEELGLEEVVPSWRKTRGTAPGIVTKEVRAPLQQEKDWGSSLFFPPARAASEPEKRPVLSLCVQQGLLAALQSHLYLWKGEVRRQESGLPIGLDLTRARARLVMPDWDQDFLRLVRDNMLNYYLYNQFLDSTANGSEL